MLDDEINKEEVKEVLYHDVGIFSSTSKGFGFIKPEDGEMDVFIPSKNTFGAFHQDRVKFEITKVETENSNREGKIVQILERNIDTLVGTYIASEKFGFVKPDLKNIGKDIFIPIKFSKKAKNNDKVVIKILSYGDNKKGPSGKVIEVLGQFDKKGVDILSVIKAKAAPTKFDKEVMECAKKIPSAVRKKDRVGRCDFTDLYTITIDGESTKDFDDAISLEVVDGIYKMGIHIADVTAYVKENDPIDKEALNRGTSIYPVDRVVPMIPEKLSVGICSLVENEDRLTLSIMIDFDEDANVISSEIVESVIRVDKRMTYSQVSKILEDEVEEKEEIKEVLKNIEKITEKLRIKKDLRGAIDFDFKEPEIKLDENGKVISISERARDRATRIIEELMLKANETVAKLICTKEEFANTPIIYRSHEVPDVDKMEGLKTLVTRFAHKFPIDLKNIKSIDVQKMLNDLSDTKENVLISTMTLRCMKRAMYSTAHPKKDDNGNVYYEPVGHFGLATKYYCHFTSPIRRYPDLINHRIIKKRIHNELTLEEVENLRKNLPEIAQGICEKEHRAIDIERDTNKIKMAEYMQDKIGEEFVGTISGMSSWGLYVLLDNCVEGMVSISSLTDGIYELDEETMSVNRQSGGKSFVIGQEVRVKVLNASKELRIIDFEFV